MNIINMLRHRRKTAFVSINAHNCVACWKCYESCPKQVFGKIDFLGHRHIRVQNADNCIGCKKCVKVCDNGDRQYQITRVRDKIGSI